MNTTTAVELKAIPATLIHEATASAPGGGPENISPVIGPLYDRLEAALAEVGVPVREPSIAYYTAEGESYEVMQGEVVVHVGYLAEPGDASGDGFALVELPPLVQAATLVHHGVMPRIGESWMALYEWADQNGYRPAGYCREVYLVADSPDQLDWVTELQLPVERIS